MKRELLFVALIGLAVLAYDYPRPDEPDQVVEAMVLSVEDAPEGNGWRLITVKLTSGHDITIKTLVPFFYRVGYIAHVGVYERRIFPDIVDLVAPPDGATELANP
ncbi:MAG: hypothetical protein JJ850_04225 [Kordiimonadaceae bacterium]|nr:hypothetical protein [Kordiimonadaceae bacterium]MBO6568475.1 hypothetical protein [Kordiimonadaceae bacterium]MBO6963796.1 hypothetical protein [Kordiimonadaceae bacterium]